MVTTLCLTRRQRGATAGSFSPLSHAIGLELTCNLCQILGFEGHLRLQHLRDEVLIHDVVAVCEEVDAPRFSFERCQTCALCHIPEHGPHIHEHVPRDQAFHPRVQVLQRARQQKQGYQVEPMSRSTP